MAKSICINFLLVLHVFFRLHAGIPFVETGGVLFQQALLPAHQTLSKLQKKRSGIRLVIGTVLSAGMPVCGIDLSEECMECKKNGVHVI